MPRKKACNSDQQWPNEQHSHTILSSHWHQTILTQNKMLIYFSMLIRSRLSIGLYLTRISVPCLQGKMYHIHEIFNLLNRFSSSEFHVEKKHTHARYVLFSHRFVIFGQGYSLNMAFRSIPRAIILIHEI